MKKYIFKCSWMFAIIFLTGFTARSQDNIPYHMETADRMVGPIDGITIASPMNADNNYVPQYIEDEFRFTSQLVSVNGQATWFKLYFDKINLGPNSYITITSLEDGGMQKLNAKSMVSWKNTSALFNGTQVEVKIHAAPNEKDIRVHVYQLLVGDFVTEDGSRTQCGPTDDRTASTDGASGRIMPEGCTGWLIPNGNFLTAGHCCATLTSINTLEFNVPASDPDGTTNAANPNDQYPVIDATINNENVQIGDDWCVFGVGVNSNTSKTPVETNGIIGSLDFCFFRVTHDNLPTTTRITGYGVDFVPSGSLGGDNAQSQTEQTSTGPFVAETVTSSTRVSLTYTVDTEGGNSGSPVFINGTRNAVGIHTNGGCNTSGSPGSNSGTSFEADDTETAIVNSTASTNKYVDENHPSASAATGTVFRPYKTVNAGITAVAAGSILNIAEGSYTETVSTNKAMIYKAPVGLVIIGPNAPRLHGPSELNPAQMENTNRGGDDITISVLPNPVLNHCIIEIDVTSAAALEINLYNSIGQLEKVLLNNAEVKEGIKKINADLSDLKGGIYMLRITLDGKTVTKKITKM